VLSGLAEGGVMTCAKHFPGHGDTLVDSHDALPVSNKTLDELYELELLPFINIAEKGADAVMLAHILFRNIDSELPSSMSGKFVSLLRNEIAFDGIIMTDDMEMKAISRLYKVPEACCISVANGADVVLICHTPDYQREAHERIKRYYLDNPQKIETKLSRMEKFLAATSRDIADLSVVGCERHKSIVEEILELSNI
ncbi:MAG: beta-N-acetylhexosaminidase, partial [Deltaproteobacteria bacterium]|nr:beta-N-acetylhexosaminidase [Deltaproteobacteria bacterium]